MAKRRRNLFIIALVLGLRDMFRSPGTGGDYGIKAGASGGTVPNP